MKFAGMLVPVAVTVAVVLGPPCASGGKKGPDRKALEKLQGEWVLVSAVRKGRALDERDIKDTTSLVFQGAKVTVRFLGGDAGTAAIKLDPGKRPAQIDVTPDVGPNKGLIHKGIYKIEGDTLTLCHGVGGGPRPSEFKSTAARPFLLHVYKRKVEPRTRERLPKPLPDPETRSPDDFELFLEGVLEAPRGPGAAASSGRYVPALRNGPATSLCAGIGGCASGTCNQGQRIPYAPVLVSPVMQWAVPHTPPSGPPAAPPPGSRQPPR